MHIFNNPRWINETLQSKKSLNVIDDQVITDLKNRLNSVIEVKNPKLSICIAAWNEELNIIKCLDSISQNNASVPYEIIVVNNNSTDRTQEILDKLGVQSYFQPIQGCGVSRQLGQERARGKFILSADADCLYPESWIDTMYTALSKNGTAAVYSRHSFLGDKQIPRWKYFLYEIGKDLIIEMRNFKRPYLSTYGMSFGYVKEWGLKEGFVTRNIRGEDGRLCFDLMKYGKIRLVRSSKARVWTSDRNLEKDGTLGAAIVKRIMRELLRLKNYFTTPEPHDTKTSENTEMSKEEYKNDLKSKFKIRK